MRKVVAITAVTSHIIETVCLLVENGYFSDEDYAVEYMFDVLDYFSLNIEQLVHREVPTYFQRLGYHVYYSLYRKSRSTTWYVFFEKDANTVRLLHLATNHTIGHLLELDI